MNRGELVPDDVTIAMVRDTADRPDCYEWCIAGWFSAHTCSGRSAWQKCWRAGMSKVDCVPYISVPADVLIERLAGAGPAEQRACLP